MEQQDQLEQLAEQAFTDVVESILADLSDVFEQRPLPTDVTYTEDFLYYMATELEKAGEKSPLWKMSRDVIADDVAALDSTERLAVQYFMLLNDQPWQSDEEMVQLVLDNWLEALRDFRMDVDAGTK